MSCDYPLWRAQLARDRSLLGEVHVALTSGGASPDISDFVREMLPFVRFHDAVLAGDAHWYDRAQNLNLAASGSEWVWFTEQDFFYTPEFIVNLLTTAEDYDMVCVERGSRITDPGCCLVRRSIVGQTSHDFASRSHADNFDVFAEEVRALARWTSVQQLGLDGWEHMNGLSHNHSLVDRGEPVTYKPDEFAAYLIECLFMTDLEPAWEARAAAWLLCYYESKREDRGEAHPALSQP